MYPYVSRMYPYVTRMLVVCYSYVSVCSVCYSYVTRMYSCGVLVMIEVSFQDGCSRITYLRYKNNINFEP